MRSSNSQSAQIDRLSETQSSRGGASIGSGFASRGLDFDLLRDFLDLLEPEEFRLLGVGGVAIASSLGGVIRMVGLIIDLDKVLSILPTGWAVNLGLLLFLGEDIVGV